MAARSLMFFPSRPQRCRELSYSRGMPHIRSEIIQFTKFSLPVLIVGMASTIFWYHSIWSHMGPIVLRDELLFSYLAMEEPSSSPFSNTLFSQVFSSVQACGPDFLLCGKTLNLGFWFLIVATLAGLSFFAKNVATTAVASWASASIVSFYVSTFLPEVMYYSLVQTAMLLALAAVTNFNGLWKIFSLASGILFGLSMLVKPHALFVELIFIVALVLGTLVMGRNFARNIQISVIVVVLSAVTRPLADWLLGSNHPFTFLASYWRGPSDPRPAFDAKFPLQSEGPQEGAPMLVEAAADSLPGYFIVACIFYLPTWLYSIRRLLSRKTPPTNLQLALFLVSSTALGMLVVSWAFGVYVTLAGDDHSERLLLRYSEFLVPLTFVFLAWVVFREPTADNSWLFGATPLFFGVIGIFLGGLGGIDLQAADSLLLTSLSGFFLWQLLVIIGLAALFWATRARERSLVPISAGMLAVGLFITTHTHMNGMGKFYIEESASYSPIIEEVKMLESENIVFVSNRRAIAAQLLLRSGKFNAQYGLVGGYSEIPAEWLEEFDYALLSKEIYPPATSRELHTEGVNSLYKLRSRPSIAQDLYTTSPQVADFSNVGVVTEWGYWVDGQNTKLTFEQTIPEGSQVVIRVIRHQETSDSNLLITVNGDEALEATLENPGELYELTLTVGELGMKDLTLSYQDAFTVIGGMGLGTFSFGMGSVDVSIPN